MITKKDLIGVWYNEEFKLVVENDNISLSKNTETEHKPSYTQEIYSEKINLVETEKTIKLSENIQLIKSKNISKVIMISIQSDRMLIIRLTKFK
jgi:hypothetical protein